MSILEMQEWLSFCANLSGTGPQLIGLPSHHKPFWLKFLSLWFGGWVFLFNPVPTDPVGGVIINHCLFVVAPARR
jgi:hypothetical protein